MEMTMIALHSSVQKIQFNAKECTKHIIIWHFSKATGLP